jgi:branched-chain amino acid transport system substrate-binding protein
MSASNSYVFFTEVLPRAIKKIWRRRRGRAAQAALEVDLPEGGTMLASV